MPSDKYSKIGIFQFYELDFISLKLKQSPRSSSSLRMITPNLPLRVHLLELRDHVPLSLLLLCPFLRVDGCPKHVVITHVLDWWEEGLGERSRRGMRELSYPQIVVGCVGTLDERRKTGGRGIFFPLFVCG